MGNRASLIRISRGLMALLLLATAPPPRDHPATPTKVAMGKQLFLDPRLSGDNKSSCIICHLFDCAFTYGREHAAAQGVDASKLSTPSLLDVGFHSKYGWDGRAKIPVEQPLVPVESSCGMNQGLDDLEKALNAVPGHVGQFQDVFGTGVTDTGIAQALAAFERSLVTKSSPFDRYRAGEKEALPGEAQEEMRLFLGEAGCARSHRGPLLYDQSFHRLGVDPGDKGCGRITGKREDDSRFRTPSLRNVALTGPYMHDGSRKTLEGVVTLYFRGAPTTHPGGLPLDLKPLLGQSFSEISPLVAFLKSLTGKAPEVTRPDLPRPELRRRSTCSESCGSPVRLSFSSHAGFPIAVNLHAQRPTCIAPPAHPPVPAPRLHGVRRPRRPYRQDGG